MKLIWIMLQIFGVSLLVAQDIEVVGYNVESGDADPIVVSEVIASIDGCDIWGLTEVQDAQWAERLRSAAEVGEGGQLFQVVMGTTGAKWGDLDRKSVV